MILYIASACSVYNLTIKLAFTVLMPHHRSTYECYDSQSGAALDLHL